MWRHSARKVKPLNAATGGCFSAAAPPETCQQLYRETVDKETDTEALSTPPGGAQDTVLV